MTTPAGAGTSATVAKPDPCLLCGAEADPSTEHIIPQTLWNRFGMDPNREDLAVYRTDLCVPQQGRPALHQRTQMMDLIETGEPVTRTALRHLGDWAVWVTLLLGLARGSGVLGAEASREFLLERFDGLRGGLPKGVRVYAARVADYREPAEPAVTRYTLALRGDSRVMLGPDNQPRGLSIRTGPLSASESIGLGLRCSSSDAPAPPDPATSSGSSRLRHRWGWNLSGRSATLSRLSSRPRSA